MITKLLIQNFILIDREELVFKPGLNIITGESGAGKSILLQALSLLLGAKSSSDLVRDKERPAVIEATFVLPSHFSTIFEEIDLTFFPEIVIRREVTQRSRIFINDQKISLEQLTALGSYLVDLISQDEKTDLFHQKTLLETLDLFGDLTKDLEAFSLSYKEQKSLEKKLLELETRQEELSSQLTKAKEDLALIDACSLQEGEIEEVEKEHHLLSHAKTLQEKIDEADLENESFMLLGSLDKSLRDLVKIDPAFEEPLSLLNSAKVELKEIFHFLLSYRGKMDSDPQRLYQIEERLSSIEKLKRRFGKTFNEIEQARNTLQIQLDSSEDLSYEITSVKEKLASLERLNHQKVELLTKKRRDAAKKISSALEVELKSLNLPHASISYELSKKVRSELGEDYVTLLFSANPNEELRDAKAVSSGGEISRLLLAIRTLLAEKFGAPLLVLDEIDANVGGRTSLMIADKLRYLGKTRQIIFITHFAQVAMRADSHFAVKKIMKEGRHQTTIEELSEQAVEIELARMMGQQVDPAP